MNETFASVLLFHTALKSFLVSSAGLTVERTLSEDDVILTDGAGAFLRLQKKTNGATTSVGVELGTNADSLEVSTKDPEEWFPFDTSVGGVFSCNATWFAEMQRADIVIIASGEKGFRRYRASVSFSMREASVLHQDHAELTTALVFREPGGTNHIQSGG